MIWKKGRVTGKDGRGVYIGAWGKVHEIFTRVGCADSRPGFRFGVYIISMHTGAWKKKIGAGRQPGFCFWG